MDFHPKKSLGQNFLINPRIVEKIIRTADLKGTETVVEVGPGFGILTEALLKAAKRVIAIEKDRALFLSLRGRFLSLRAQLMSLRAQRSNLPSTTNTISISSTAVFPKNAKCCGTCFRLNHLKKPVSKKPAALKRSLLKNGLCFMLF